MSIFPTKILLATDGSEEAALAAQSALEIANNTGSKLHVVHVGAPLYIPRHYEGLYMGEYIEEEEKELERRAQGLLDGQLEKLKATGGSVVVQAYLRIGTPDEEIIALAEKLGVGLIVIGSRGRGGVRRALMGSVSDSVVRHAPCPVLVVRGSEEKREEEVVPLGREDWRPPSEESEPQGREDRLLKEEKAALGREDQEEAAAVELYEDEAGGLYIFPEGEENGFYLPGGGPGGLFRRDARAIAGGHTEFWRMDLSGATRDAALNVGATHVATWKNDDVTVHQRPGSNARRYLGMG